MISFLVKLRASLDRVHHDTKGMSTLEIVLIIVVLIALVIMFRNTIVNFVSNILNKISGQGNTFDPGVIAQ